MNEGRLFVLEGIDGSGKTTLSSLFAHHLRTSGRECLEYSFPGTEKGSLGRHLYKLHHDLRGFGITTINPTALQLLHIAAHIDGIERKMLPALRAGKDVVLDRFWWSTFVYGLSLGADEESLRSMVALERSHWGKVTPTAVFLLRRECATTTGLEPLRGTIEQTYINLSREETGSYPVFDIFNGGEVDVALNQLIRFAEEASSPSIESNCGFNTLNGPDLLFQLAPAKTTIVYDTYWKFAAERQEIFFRRVQGQPSPWTKDSILKDYKFTNAYRASDRVSQYLISNVIDVGDQTPEELFFRIVLFKIFNRIETWELLSRKLGRIAWCEFDAQEYGRILEDAMQSEQSIYSAAYIMPTGGRGNGYARKHQMHLALIEEMMYTSTPSRIASAAKMQDVFEIFRSFPTIGDFLAFQYTIDLNYSTLTNFREMDFVVPGPGALSGIAKCFSDLGGLNETDVICLVADRQEYEFERLGLKYRDLWGRPLQLIDCQNLFCEVDKYSRIAHPEFSRRGGRARIKQRFLPSNNPIVYQYPRKWRLKMEH